MRVCVIVPAYNEQGNIASTLQDIRNANKDFVIAVINDGSTDCTAKVASKEGIAKVISLPCNLGIGGAVQTGFKYANENNFDIAIQFDGDGQHIAAEIQKLLEPLLQCEADAVIGSRFLHKNQQGFRSTFMRRIGIKIFEIICRVFIRKRISDCTSGFRAYNKKAIEMLASNYPTDFPEPEAIILLGKNHFRIKEVAVEMRERIHGKSSIGGLKSAYYMIKVILAMSMAKSRAQLKTREENG
ncbi:MAG: glycosyltransferase family 2 protein [Fibromonadaceae bacterium]|jgi:glycosyltransferase involved in cell wall biosynthesis|nr:glycosyltransferase family 2 protein [Fibromonadaceae bacterium]